MRCPARINAATEDTFYQFLCDAFVVGPCIVPVCIGQNVTLNMLLSRAMGGAMRCDAQYRMAQLLAIDSALRASLPNTALTQMVLLGDLNFR